MQKFFEANEEFVRFVLRWQKKATEAADTERESSPIPRNIGEQMRWIYEERFAFLFDPVNFQQWLLVVLSMRLQLGVQTHRSISQQEMDRIVTGCEMPVTMLMDLLVDPLNFIHLRLALERAAIERRKVGAVFMKAAQLAVDQLVDRNNIPFCVESMATLTVT